MAVRNTMRAVMLLSTLLSCAVVMAQTPSPQQPRRPLPPKTTSADKVRRAPQVVTIVHRLNGLKMFRLLLRSQEQVQAVESLNSAFNLMDDVHTNVIAGLAMDDGETIAAWLPEADVEFGPEKNSLFASPDITVMGPNGNRIATKYIGLDAVTGLSILKVSNKSTVAAGALTDKPVKVGETVVLFGPEPVTKFRAAFTSLYVRMGATQGRIQDVFTAPSGDIARFKVSAAKLSQANIGGVAVNEAGETIGIVDGLEGNEASILPAALIRRAADRVLDQQASVPRPWLGVSGKAIAELKFEQILNHGWEMNRASALAGKHRGIMLTSIVPGSPAAQAELRAGDVILKVGDKDIQNDEDFTWWLDQAGPSNSVQFTVARPDRPAEEPLRVKLSGMFNPVWTFRLRNQMANKKGFSLIDQGIETIALKPPVASQLGTTAGLLVVYVEPSTPASEAGLQAGDVIQSINGKPPASYTPATQAPSFTFEVVRNKTKRVVKVPARKK